MRAKRRSGPSVKGPRSGPSPFGRIPRAVRPSVGSSGYSLHAARAIDADQRDALERLCRYGARAPIAHERLSREPDGTVVIALRKPLRDGRTALRFSPLELLRRLVTLIPPPRANLTRYHGVFAPNHHLRSQVVALGRDYDDSAPGQTARAPTPPRRRLDWASLLRRVFAIDVLRCDACGGAMRILAVLCEGDATRAILEHLARRAAPPPHRALDPPGASVV